MSKDYVWKQLEDFPRYELNHDGDMRFIETKRLRKRSTSFIGEYYKMHRGKDQFTKFIHKLVKEYFPNGEEWVDELVDPIEWRQIPCAEAYEVTADGVVRHIDTKKIIKTQKPDHLYPFVIFRHKNIFRREIVAKLVADAWPELQTFSQWRIISEFPDYAIHEDGMVKNLKNEKLITIIRNGEKGHASVALMKDGKFYRRGLLRLYYHTFGRKLESDPELPRTKVYVSKKSAPILAGEYRIIEKYPDYKMNDAGDIFHIETNEAAYFAKFKGPVAVLKKNGEEYATSVGRLYKETWPEKELRTA